MSRNCECARRPALILLPFVPSVLLYLSALHTHVIVTFMHSITTLFSESPSVLHACLICPQIHFLKGECRSSILTFFCLCVHPVSTRILVILFHSLLCFALLLFRLCPIRRLDAITAWPSGSATMASPSPLACGRTGSSGSSLVSTWRCTSTLNGRACDVRQMLRQLWSDWAFLEFLQART